MPTATYAGKAIEVDEQGFMTDADQWTEDIATAIAADKGVGPLNDLHWKVIEFCRMDAREMGTPPGVRRIVKNVDGVSMKDMYKLFPKGPGKLAAMVSGLTKPTGCV